MAGPVAGVLLRKPLNAKQHMELENLLDSLGTRGAEQGDVFIFTTLPLGEVYENKHGWPFLVNIETPFLEDTESTLIEEAWGFIPQQQILINAMTNSRESHRILGLLALRIAEKHDGIIDFCGALFPKLPEDVLRDNWFWEAKWDDVARYSHELTESLPGTVVEAFYLTISDRIWASQYCRYNVSARLACAPRLSHD